jgi:hypothetical protein
MKFISLIFINSLMFFSTSTHAFTLNNTAQLIFKKDEVMVNIAAGNCDNIGIDEHELLSIVSDAVNQYWNKSPTSSLKMRAGSVKTKIAAYKTDAICLPSTSCDPNPVLAVDSDILITCNNDAVGNFPSNSILAVTVPNNISGKYITGSLIMINDRAGNQFITKSRDEKVSIIAHELGHAFGLGHSPVQDSLMYYTTVNMRKSLGADDIDGITYLYPKQQPMTCSSVNEQNKPNTWLGLLLGFGIIGFVTKFQSRYLKLRPRA